MGYKSLSQKRVAGESAIASGIGVYASLTSGGGYNISGQSLTATTSVTQTIVTPGQSSTTSNVGAAVTAITSISAANINYSAISGAIYATSYILITGTGFVPTGYLTLNNTTLVGNVYYSSTQLRANLGATSNLSYTGNLNLAYCTPQSNLYISPPPSVEYLVIAGGGSGGYSTGGGGGAGGYLSTVSGESSGGGTSAGAAVLVPAAGTTWTITVGNGGPGTASSYSNGGNSIISGSGLTTVTAIGGGAGSTLPTGITGGSGGGSYSTAAAGTTGQGYAAGTGGGLGYNTAGGGGAGGIGGNPNDIAGSSGYGGNGGAGVTSSITGLSVARAGGGGGGAYFGAGRSGSGTAGGGNGSFANYTLAVAANVNTGGGGGGGGWSDATYKVPGNGGSGVVILKLPSSAASTTGSPVITTVGTNTIYQFNQNGTITF